MKDFFSEHLSNDIWHIIWKEQNHTKTQSQKREFIMKREMVSNNNYYVVEIKSSIKSWFEEKAFIVDDKHDSATVFLSAAVFLKKVRVEHPDQIYRLILKSEKIVLIDI